MKVPQLDAAVQPLETATPPATHLKHVSMPADMTVVGQVPVALPTLQLMAWAEATRTMAKKAT